MNTGTTLGACLVIADVRARSTAHAQTITGLSTPNGVRLDVLESREIMVLKDQDRLDGREPLLSILPDGTVELYPRITLPPEATAPCV